MAISWGSIENKAIETGVDRGVLYTGTVSVPWDGLVSVTEKTGDDTSSPSYYEGLVFYVGKDPGTFSASVGAFSYPAEFEPFQGRLEITPGLYANHQITFGTFDFSYRTLVADGIKGIDAGYKIHLIYNAVAIPTDRERTTINESIEADIFTWDVVCCAERPTWPEPRAIRPTSHYLIDSRKLSASALLDVENLIYGPVGEPSPPSLPNIPIIADLISA